MFPATRVGLVAVMILGLGLAAQDEPSREFVMQKISDSPCDADAMNQLGEVAVTCSVGFRRTLSYVWDGSGHNEKLVDSRDQGGSGCLFYRILGLSNARQRLQESNYLSNCGFGGGWTTRRQLVSGRSAYDAVEYYYATPMNGSGRFAYRDRVWMGPGDFRNVPGLAPVELRDLNDQMQAIYRQEPKRNWYRVNVITGGVDEIAGMETSWRTMNQRGWVAGVNAAGQLVLWDGIQLTGVAKAPPRSYVLNMNDHGWVVGIHYLGDTSVTDYWLWDGVQFLMLSALVPESKIVSIAGITNEGKIALTLQRGDEKFAALLTPVDLLEQPPVDLVKPEAGPEAQGQGELLGCDGFKGWVRDHTRPDFPLPLEVYEGTRLIAAGIASQRQVDGSWLFQLPIPPRLFDGQPHFVNVRFAGTATAVDQAWGTIQCDPAQ